MTVRIPMALLIFAAAQAAAPALADEAVSTVRDDSYQLDVRDRRIDRGPYDASLQVGIDRPVSLRVGATVHASHIVLMLHEVHGTVRFHGDLSRLQRIAASHVGAAGAKEKP